MAGNDAYTVLLLNCDGSDTSTTFTDTSAGGTTHTVTAVGDAQVDTAQKEFGTGSMQGLAETGGDYLSVPNHADFDFGTGDFAIDFWARFDNLPGDLAQLYSYDRTTGILIYLSAADKLDVFIEGTRYITENASINADTWYHIALTRDGTDLRLFVGGSQLGPDATCSADIGGSGILTLGNDDAVNYGIDGWMDEIRISKGDSRWTANFTPPTEAYSGVGTNTQVNIGDSWKEIAGMQVNIGDSWKEVASAQVNIGDSWKGVF